MAPEIRVMHTKLALVGILASLGTALGASGACPPEEGCTNTVGQVEGHPLTFRTVVGRPLGAIEVQGQPLTVRTVQGRPLGAVEVQGQPLTVRTVEGRPLGAVNVQGQPLRVRTVRGEPLSVRYMVAGEPVQVAGQGADITVQGEALDVTDLDAVKVQGTDRLIPSRLIAMAQPEPKARTMNIARARAQSDGKGDSNVVLVQNGETISLKMQDGKVVSLERNGKAVPTEQVRKDGNTVILLDADGKTVQRINLGEKAEAIAVAGGGMPADAQELFVAAEPPKAMIGVQLGEPDGMLLGHFGLDAGAATLITGVYKDLPAGKAGIHPYDIVVAVNGNRPAGPAELREALRGLDDGDKVVLRVIHRGEEKDVKVELVKYDADTLQGAELDAVQNNAVGFSLGGGAAGDNIFVAPGLPAMRNAPQGMDSDKMREFAEHWRQEAEKLAERYKDGVKWEQRLDAQGGPTWVAPTTPAPPAPASAPRAANEERWQRLEERLARLEEMLERLAEKKAGPGR
jgi:membrane-associated protease RseP (regulator of RpoE activity)